MSRRLIGLALLITLAVSPPRSLAAQVGGPLQSATAGGLPALLQELRMLGHNKRVLMIGAHPDDEDTQLLVLLTRREGAEAAYLSLTRGEGGQDLIGSELGEALGILRTEELLAARNVDGAQQYFSRAYDFGFSKTLDDTWAHWPKDSVLKDVVRIVRRYRPQVIVAVFSGTPRDGHGQHQAAGWAAAEAYRVAGDPTRFPELATEEGLRPWTPSKLYIEAWFNPGAATLTLDGGEMDRVSGKTYHQLAMAGRSLHRSQDMGQIQEFGASPSRLTFGAVRGGSADVGDGWAGFWSGVDTTLHVSADHFAALADARTAAVAGGDVAGPLARAYRALNGAAGWDSVARANYVMHLARARAIGAGLFLDVVADHDHVVPGDTLGVTFLSRNGGSAPTDALIPSLSPLGSLTRDDLGGVIGAGQSRNGRILVPVPAGAEASTPYYLRAPRDGDLYHWNGDVAARGTPMGATLFDGALATTGAAAPIELRRAASTRTRDQANGEVRRPVFVAPRVSVAIGPEVVVVRQEARGDARTAHFEVALRHWGAGSVRGRVRLDVPWLGATRAPEQEFALAGEGSEAHLAFDLAVPEGIAAGTQSIRAEAIDAGGARYGVGVFSVEYPHIRTVQYTRPAVARLEVLDLTLPALRRVAYVRGAADRVPEALAAAGFPVTLLDSAALASADLSGYDAVIVGARAYEIDSSLVRNNGRLLDYARNGGRLIVQYQQGVFVDGNFAPYPVTQGSPADRITDEYAAATMLGERSDRSALAPEFRTPNAIGPVDWDGWIQDRALYCLRSWGPEYESLLTMHDPGEAPIGGCLLKAGVGRGSYVYTGLAFFRELPAGVPGAYRLFFNLLGGRATP